MFKVSVIIPVYNAQEYLRQCLDSIIYQSLSDIEIICVDDGSTDDSVVILTEYAAKDSRIKVLLNEHKNVGVARNAGMAVATGAYYLFLDADDMLISNTILARVFEKVENTDCDCLLAGARGVTISGKLGEMLRWCLRTDLAPSAEVFSGKSVGLKLFFLAGPVPWAKLFRRDFVLRHNLLFLALSRSEDFPFVQLALALSQRTTIFKEPLVLHRIGVTGSLESTKDETPCIFAEAEQFFFKELRNRGLEGEFGDAARARAMLRFDYNLHAMHSFEGLDAVFERVRKERAKMILPRVSETFADFALAKANVDKILSYGSAGEWLCQRLVYAETQLRSIRCEMRVCQERLEALKCRECTIAKNVLRQGKGFACLIIRFIKFSSGKAYGGIKCLHENGVKYTIKHALGKVLRCFGSKVKW